MAQLLAEVENFLLRRNQSTARQRITQATNKTYGIQPAIFLRRWVNNSTDKYHLLLETAKFTPTWFFSGMDSLERHFHPLGAEHMKKLALTKSFA